jgi:toxin HigB-1
MLDMSRLSRHAPGVIVSYANRATERFALEGKSKFSGLDEDKASGRLQVLDDAVSLDDIPPLRSFGLHALSGDRHGQWAITINAGWRLVFRFENGNATDVEIVDYH